MRSKPEGKQIRMTLEDTLYYQAHLKHHLKMLISENRPIELQEKQYFFEMITKALLSSGTSEPIYFVKDNGWFIFSSAQNLAHRLADMHTSNIRLKTDRPEQVETIVGIAELWRFLYDKFLYLFPQACAEALHLSAEAIERPKQGTFKFSAKGDLND